MDSISLPTTGSRTVLVPGWDAGTEINTEDFADLVPPCQGLIGVSSGDPGTDESNPALAEGGVIHHHLGILGAADLEVETHNWTNPVAKITITCIDEKAKRFSTSLSGAGENPIVSSFGTGAAGFFLRGSGLKYSLNVGQVFGVTQAHIHLGLPSENGPPVAFLFGPVDPTGLVNGQLARGTIKKGDLLNDFAGDFPAFEEALRRGELYVNLHTSDTPSGELRGQIGASHRGNSRGGKREKDDRDRDDDDDD